MNDEEKDVTEIEEEDIEKEEGTHMPKKSSTPLEIIKKSSGVSAKKREVKPVDEAEAEPAEVAPPASMLMAGDRIRVQSLWPARLVVRGTPSGKTYVWANSGAIETVNPADVGFLMSKNRGESPSDGRGCCGGDGTRIYFQLI